MKADGGIGGVMTPSENLPLNWYFKVLKSLKLL